jgi:hypothetical protein
MNGKGNFPAQKNQNEKRQTSEAKENLSTNPESNSQILSHSISEDKTIERIVVFYKDGTFKNFEHSK